MLQQQEAVNKMAVIGKRFGDERSTLLDEFERMSFEAHAAQLSRAMLGRSLSEPPALPRSQSQLICMAPIPMVTQVMMMQGRPHSRSRHSGFHKFIKKLVKPILGMKRGTRKQVPDKDPPFCKAFSKSLRF
ncbi:hypothetical protein Lal_00041825 [Lupinus albus]|uniref:Uncharacterized protein n=1 Tax=Lupinus albus TaxID=3870 RepID=A0A6A4QYY3_LUPAL|nr:hypothetical protein Lalb_Chr03g0043771 [Lupinus albus]KAF1895546.1 hypothetical protein Lal_00041825 [Lupinus albus]